MPYLGIWRTTHELIHWVESQRAEKAMVAQLAALLQRTVDSLVVTSAACTIAELGAPDVAKDALTAALTRVTEKLPVSYHRKGSSFRTNRLYQGLHFASDWWSLMAALASVGAEQARSWFVECALEKEDNMSACMVFKKILAARIRPESRGMRLSEKDLTLFTTLKVRRWTPNEYDGEWTTDLTLRRLARQELKLARAQCRSCPCVVLPATIGQPGRYNNEYPWLIGRCEMCRTHAVSDTELNEIVHRMFPGVLRSVPEFRP